MHDKAKLNTHSDLKKIAVKLLILFLGFGLGITFQDLFLSKQKPTSEIQNDQVIDNESEQTNSEIIRQGEKASYQFIAGVPAEVYFHGDYGFDVEFLSQSPPTLFEQIPDIELYLEVFLKKFGFFIGELNSLAIYVDVENQRLYAAIEISESQYLNAVFLAESDIYGGDFKMTAFDVQVRDDHETELYTSQSVLGYYPSQRAILIKKSSEANTPCTKNSFELIYKDGSSKKIAQSLEGSCADNADFFLNYDGEYLYFAKIEQADSKFNYYAKGASLPRSMVNELYKLHPLTGIKKYSSQDFSKEVSLVPIRPGYDHHSSTFDTSKQRGEFSPAGGVMLENAELREDSFIEIK